MSRFSPGCLCCGPRFPCDDCRSGFAPAQLKLVIPTSTFVNNTTAPDLIYPDGQTLCPDAPGCDFYAGTYLLTLDDCTGLAECCCLSICFDHDDASGCDCGVAQSAACAAFCVIQACLDQDDEGNYVLDVFCYYGSAVDVPLCGSCDGKEAVGFAGQAVQFRAVLGSEPPDCDEFDNVECPLFYSPPNPCTGDMSWCPDCTAVSDSSVFISSA